MTARDVVVLTGSADLRDQRWLDERIADIESGIEAVLEIATNWLDGRNVARLHPGVSAAEYVKSKVGPLRLGKADVTVLLAETNWSNRQIAAVAGVSHTQVARIATGTFVPVERPATTLGADGKLRAAPSIPWTPSPALMSSDSPEWYTPKRVIEAVVKAMGAIDLDPCADPGKTVPAANHYTEADDGLSRRWLGRVYMNPPYGRAIGAWVDKLVGAYGNGVTEAIALLPGRIETDWFAALDAIWVCFIHGRLAFSDHETSAPFPSVAVYLGREGDQFGEAFVALGDVYERRWRYAR